MTKWLLPILCLASYSFSAQKVFQNKPEPFNPVVSVAACYITYQGKILYLQRNPLCSWGNHWGLPARAIEPHETPAEAIIREVFEETGIDLAQNPPQNLLMQLYVCDAQKDFIYYIFECELTQKPAMITLAPAEHIDWIWLHPEKALEDLLLVPGEDECINLIQQRRLKDSL